MNFTALVVVATLMPNAIEQKPNSGLPETKKDMYQSELGHYCELCPIGFYLVEDCKFNGGPTNCSPCPEYHFMDKKNNETACSRCTKCNRQINNNMVRTCTKTSDTLCHCPSGKYWYADPGGTGFCKLHTVCQGETLNRGTPWIDTVCGEATTEPSTTPRPSTTPSPETNINISTTTPGLDPPSTDGGVCLSYGAITGIALGPVGFVFLVFIFYRVIKKYDLKQKLRQMLTYRREGGKDIASCVEEGNGESQQSFLLEEEEERRTSQLLQH